MKVDIYDDFSKFILKTTGKTNQVYGKYSSTVLSFCVMDSVIEEEELVNFFNSQKYDDLYLHSLNCSHYKFEIRISPVIYFLSQQVNIRLLPRSSSTILCKYTLGCLQRRFLGESFESEVRNKFCEQQKQIANILFRKNKNSIIRDRDGRKWLKIIDENNIEIRIKIISDEHSLFNVYTQLCDDDFQRKQDLICLVVGSTIPKYVLMEHSFCKILFLDREELLQNSREHFVIERLKRNTKFSKAVENYRKSLWKPDGYYCKKNFASCTKLLK